jgi:hypothetical protein
MGQQGLQEGGHLGGPCQASCIVYNDTYIVTSFMLTSSQTSQLISNVNQCLVWEGIQWGFFFKQLDSWVWDSKKVGRNIITISILSPSVCKGAIQLAQPH